jgi:hypothetical protein
MPQDNRLSSRMALLAWLWRLRRTSYAPMARDCGVSFDTENNGSIASKLTAMVGTELPGILRWCGLPTVPEFSDGRLTGKRNALACIQKRIVRGIWACVLLQRIPERACLPKSGAVLTSLCSGRQIESFEVAQIINIDISLFSLQ